MVPCSLTVLVPLALRTAPAPAQELIQPWTYRSPSGAVELFVTPSQRDGSGPARCRLSRAGELAWARELPFTLRDASVLDDSTAAGFAYPGGSHRPDGDLVVVVLAPDGSVRGEERVPRVSRVEHGASDPTALELRGNAEGFALKVCGPLAGSERWWVYDWSTCRRVAVQREEPGGERSRPVSGDGVFALSDVALFELPVLGRVTFPWPVPIPEGPLSSSAPEQRNRRPHRVFVDERRRIWLSELSTRIVHAFDASGQPLFDRHPEPAHFRPYRPCDWLAVRGDRSLFVGADQAVEETDLEGKFVRRIAQTDIPPPRWIFQPGGGRWVIDFRFRRIVLEDAEGKEVSAVERGANGRWFQDLWEASAAPDGALAVLDEPNEGIRSRDPSTWVHLLDTSGKPLRSLRVPDAFSGGHVAYDGGRIALLRGRELLFVAGDGRMLGRATLPESMGEPYHFFFGPPGELWVFPHYPAEMVRLGLPR
jgi:hypothetical protein